MYKHLSTWLLKPLKEVTTIISGSTPNTNVPEFWNGDIAWATPKDLSKLNSIYFENTEKRITKLGYESCSSKLLPEGTILFSSRAPIGHIAITKTPMCTNQGFKNLVPGPNIDSKYLYFCLKRFTPYIQSLGRGATFTEISKELIGDVKIPVPPLPIQKKIGAILEKADHALHKRQETLRLTDQFLQSAFLKMFGDPVKNPKRWKVVTMDEACSKITDGTHHSPPTYSKGFPYITAKNIKIGNFDLENLTFVSEKDHREIYKRCNPIEGDVLYIKDGVTTGIAKFNNLSFPFSMLSSLALLRPNRMVLDGRFLEAFLNFPTVYTRNTHEMKGGAIKRLTIEKIRRLYISLPPISEQNKFTLLVEKMESLRRKQTGSQLELKNIFQSIMKKAFKEELFQ